MITSFYPVVAGRVSDGLARNRSLYQIQSDQISLQSLQRQLSTGYKFQNVSESPNAALRVLDLQREQEFKEQTLVNIKSAQSYLTTSESALSEVQTITNEIRGIAVEGVTNVQTDADRESLVTQLNSYLERLVGIGNQKSRDRFLFTAATSIKLQWSFEAKSFAFAETISIFFRSVIARTILLTTLPVSVPSASFRRCHRSCRPQSGVDDEHPLVGPQSRFWCRQRCCAIFERNRDGGRRSYDGGNAR